MGFSAMPAFKSSQTDEQIWAITAFVTQKLSKMSADEYKDWKSKYAINNILH